MKISAPGKVILHGEHAVVYGKRALSVALSNRCLLTVDKDLSLSDETFQLVFESVSLNLKMEITLLNNLLVLIPNFEVTNSQQISILLEFIDFRCIKSDSSNNNMLRLACLSFFGLCLLLKPQLNGLKLSLISEIPIGSGMGSSAAFAACISVFCLVTTRKLSNNSVDWLKADYDLINHYAYCSEQLIHGTPSGIDNTTIVFGNAISFISTTLYFSFKVPSLEMFVLDTHIMRSTKDVVTSVRNQYNSSTFSSIYKHIFDAISELSLSAMHIFTEMALVSSNTESYKKLYEDYLNLILINQSLLEGINVSHPVINKICAMVKPYASAKLTGAGWGGCMLLMFKLNVSEKEKKECLLAISKEGITYFPIKLGQDGVRIDNDC